MNLEALYINRKSYVDIARKNNFEEGLLKLLTELYPDNAHFIYELLQNAEDTGATKILLELQADQLKFSHNGTKLFDFNDVDSITSIGNSTKKDDVNTIGKFGVGFKAVFSYTKTPRIYSNKISFEIIDLFIPKQISPITIVDPYTTTMVFPFNHPQKNSTKAFQEVKDHLENLSDLTLLFLKNINELMWDIDDRKFSLKRLDKSKNQVQILNSKNESSSTWLKFIRLLPDQNKLYVAIAYKLEAKEQEPDKFEILPIDGTVSIFFPADKETSKLKFHIHAPFASTVARDSIKDLKENIALIEYISELVVDSILEIKKEKLLNTDFFEVLPIPDDDLSNLYLPIQKKIYDTFQTVALLPTESGDFADARHCYRTPSDIKRVFSRDDLPIILDKDLAEMYFVKSPRQLNSRADKFVQSLKIEEWGWKEFENSIRMLNDDIREENVNKRTWIEVKSVEWLQAFYALLWTAYNRHDTFQNYVFYGGLASLKSLVKLEESFNYKEDEAYFSDVDNNLIGLKYVDILTYTSGTNKKQQEKAKDFLREIGVKNITEKERIEIILKEYYSNQLNTLSLETHLKHVDKLIEYYNSGNDISFVKKYYFILCIKDSQKYWETPDILLIDQPFETTGLQAIVDISNKYLIDDQYLQLKNIKQFVAFLKELDAQSHLEVISVPHHNNPQYNNLYKGTYSARLTSKVIRTDYTIENIEKLLDKKAFDVSLLVWKTMNGISSEKLKARYRPNATITTRSVDSQLVHSLKKYEWIPSKEGNFYFPSDISEDMLAEAFDYDNRNGWLTAIGFAGNIEKEKEDYIEKEAIIQELGFDSLDELAIFQKLKENFSPEELVEIVNKREDKIDEKELERQSLRRALESDTSDGNSKAFVEPKGHDSTIIDEQKHEDNIHTENEDNKNEIRTSTTQRSRQDAKELELVNSFLRNEYEGHCQICGDTFAIGDNNFFKIRSLNLGSVRDVNRKGNTLCVCPKHWEIFHHKLVGHTFYENIKEYDSLSLDILLHKFKVYDWVGKEDINENRDAFYMLDDEDKFTRDGLFFLPIKIFAKTEFIKFTKDHIMNFIEVWNHN